MAKAGLFEGINLSCLGQCDPLNLHIGRRTNPVLIKVNAILKQLILNNSKSNKYSYFVDAEFKKLTKIVQIEEVKIHTF